MDLSPTEEKIEEASHNEEATEGVALEPVPEPNLQTQSAFMKLRLELLLELYKLVFLSARPITNPREQLKQHRDYEVDRIPNICSFNVVPCKHIGKEARSVFEGGNLSIFARPSNVRRFRTVEKISGTDDCPIP